MMVRTLTVAIAALTTACSQGGDPAQGNAAASEPATVAAPTPVDDGRDTGAGPVAPTPSTPAALPTPMAGITPVLLTPEAERGEKGARNLLLAFARAIEQRDYGTGWALLAPADQRKWSKADFAALFADLDRPTVAVPTGTIEGAAGSSYYTAPITVTGTGRDGRPVRLEGEAVLRRVNDVDGANPAQLRWHFDRLTLAWTH